MKFLTETQKYLKLVGLTAHQSIQKCPFNVKNVVCLTVLYVASASAVSLMLFQANTFEEYTNSMYPTSCWICAGINFNVFIWKMDKIFEFIEHFEKLIEKREFNLLIV